MHDPPPPYEAIVPTPQAVGVADRPRESVSLFEAAGLRIMLEPDGTLQERATLSDEAKFSLKSVLQEIKGRILPGVLVTDQDFRKWMDMIYADDWHPGEFCRGGDHEMTGWTPRVCSYAGTLRDTLQMGPSRAGSARPRSFSGRELHQANAPRATPYWRQAGAPVFLFVEHNNPGCVSFSFRDQKMVIIDGEVVVNCVGNGAADMYFHAMKRNDEFMALNVHKNNILQGVYICRNRLTYWSNPGTCAGQVPPCEQLSLALSVVRLCRNMETRWILGCPKDAKARIRATTPPELFP